MNYIIWVNIYLTLFYGFYWFFMRKETFFELNRWYLLSSPLVAFMLPVLDLKKYFWTPKVEFFSVGLNFEGQVNGMVGSAEQSGTPLDAVWALPMVTWIYFFGCFFFFSKLFYQGILIKKSLQSTSTGQAYSFFHIIHVDPEVDNYSKVLAHEQVHVRQFHSADILLLELVKIFNWFNPVAYLLCRSAKLNHEYIADAHTAQHGLDRIQYAESLLSNAFQSKSYSLNNNFVNESFIKSRIAMLFKSKSKKSVLSRFLILVPVLLVIVAFQTKKPEMEVTSADIAAFPSVQTPSSGKSLFLVNQTGESATPKELAVDVKPSGGASSPRPEMESSVDQQGDEGAPKLNQPLKKDPQSLPNNRNDDLFIQVEEAPVPPGGMSSFLKYVGQHYTYPEEAVAAKVEGRIITTFIVEADGSLSDVRTVRDLGHGTGEEAVRVIRSGEKWKPGIQNGQAVKVQYTMPIVLNLGEQG